MSERSVAERMEEALHVLDQKWRSKRRPKAFYLTHADWDAFRMAAPVEIVRSPFGNNPTQWLDEPGFRGVPVRLTKSERPDHRSALYDHTSQGRALPD